MRAPGRLVGMLALALCLAAPAQAAVDPTAPIPGAAYVTYGIASWYGGSFFHGRKMANGRRFDRLGHSAAHRTLPLGTRAKLRSLRTGRSETITIEDRGPFIAGRFLDVSEGTASRLGILQDGVGPVELVVEPDGWPPSNARRKPRQ